MSKEMIINWNAGPAIVEMQIKEQMKALKTVAGLQALKAEVKEMRDELDIYIPATVVARIGDYIDMARTAFYASAFND